MSETILTPGSETVAATSGGAIALAQTVVVAVDAMGGDYAPAQVVRGAALYARDHGDDDNATLLLVGDPDRIAAELSRLADTEAIVAPPSRLQVIAAAHNIGMNEHPTEALRDKPDASLAVCNRLVKSGAAHASFSAGNTGAMMVSANQVLERIEGVKRPAIATLFPNESGQRTVLVDAGANVDCRPSWMAQFALLGSVYAERALGIPSPRVGILSNGEEEAKGNDLVREALPLLKAMGSTLNFVGPVEGNHIFEGIADVVVCDGFVGNIVLKGTEGMVRLVLSQLAEESQRTTDDTTRNALLDLLLRLRQKLDYTEFGGAPLLGVNGVVFVAHGRSDSRAILTGIRMATLAARSGYVAAIRDALAEKTAAL